METPCFLGIRQGKGMAATPEGRKALVAEPQWSQRASSSLPCPALGRTSDQALQDDLSPLPNSDPKLKCDSSDVHLGEWHPQHASLVGVTWILSNLKELSDISAL